MKYERLKGFGVATAAVLPLLGSPALAKDPHAVNAKPHISGRVEVPVAEATTTGAGLKGSLFFRTGATANPVLFAAFPSTFGRPEDKTVVSFTPYAEVPNLGMASETQISFSTIGGVKISCSLIETAPQQYTASATTLIGDDVQTVAVPPDEMLGAKVAIIVQGDLFSREPMNGTGQINKSVMRVLGAAEAKCLEVAPLVPIHNDEPANNRDRHGSTIQRSTEPSSDGLEDNLADQTSKIAMLKGFRMQGIIQPDADIQRLPYLPILPGSREGPEYARRVPASRLG